MTFRKNHIVEAVKDTVEQLRLELECTCIKTTDSPFYHDTQCPYWGSYVALQLLLEQLGIDFTFLQEM